MSDPALALQGAINVRVRAEVTTVASRVYDAVPEAPTYPYISFGEFQTVEDGAGCIEADEVYITLHVWSRGVGSVEAHQIARSARDAIHEWMPDLTAAGRACVEITHRSTRVLRDPDGITTHAILNFRALIEAL